MLTHGGSVSAMIVSHAERDVDTTVDAARLEARATRYKLLEVA
jgi:hypothetical protein